MCRTMMQSFILRHRVSIAFLSVIIVFNIGFYRLSPGIYISQVSIVEKHIRPFFQNQTLVNYEKKRQNMAVQPQPKMFKATSSFTSFADVNNDRQNRRGRPYVIRRNTTLSIKTGVKKFIYVNPFPGLDEQLKFHHCKYKDCSMTKSIAEADVLMFNAARMRDLKLPHRRPNQIWVMYSKESPDLPRLDHLDRPDLLNQVNYSRMVLSDSTWQNKYGSLRRRPLPDKNYGRIYRQKQHDVAWFVSQCSRPSRRMEYVQRMMKTVNIHIYGRCGNYTCGSKGYSMGSKKTQCLDLLTERYKFYLAFENTLCRDYVTEKFFNIFEEVDTIPVVRGGADYSRLFPDGIYINTAKFSSPEQLGKYLHELARDEQKYVAMLREKNRYTKTNYETNFMCDLCKRAHTGHPRHTYKDFYKWLRAPNNCWSPTDL